MKTNYPQSKLNPFISGSGSAKLYSAPGYLPPEPQRPQTVPCQGNGRTCVSKYQCQGGYVDASQLNGQNSQVIYNPFYIYKCSDAKSSVS